MQFMMALAGCLAIQGGPLWWVAHHRSHHRDTDTPADIHSPVTKGFWQSHMGWMMSAGAFQEKGANSRDLHKFPEIKWLQRYYVVVILAQAVALYALGAGLNAWRPEWGTSGPQMLVWGLFISTVVTWHNNHHMYPSSARHGLERWQLDITWLVLKTLEKLRLVSDLKVPRQYRSA